jgi:hypothetical protein
MTLGGVTKKSSCIGYLSRENVLDPDRHEYWEMRTHTKDDRIPLRLSLKTASADRITSRLSLKAAWRWSEKVPDSTQKGVMQERLISDHMLSGSCSMSQFTLIPQEAPDPHYSPLIPPAPSAIDGRGGWRLRGIIARSSHRHSSCCSLQFAIRNLRMGNSNPLSSLILQNASCHS